MSGNAAPLGNAALLSTSNIHVPVSVILSNVQYVSANVESFQDTRTAVKSLANYCKLDTANIAAAINRTELSAEQTNALQNLKASLQA